MDHRRHTQSEGKNTIKTQREKTSREKGRDKSHMSKCVFIAVCQVYVRKWLLLNVLGHAFIVTVP